MRRHDDIQGRTVISADGQVVGTVASLMINDAQWRIESIIIELRKEIADRIGADHGIFHRAVLELPVSSIQSVGDAVVLELDVDELRGLRERPAADEPLGAPSKS